LDGLGVPFKAPASLEEVRRLNSGIRYSYSQVGKVFTIYPRTDEEAVNLARLLHRLTRRMRAPAVPFDLRYRPGSNVYYRYGAFKMLEMELPGGGGRVSAVRNPRGEMVPDMCVPEKAKPTWAEDPFAVRRPQRGGPTVDSLLKTTFRVFGALSQRGKGGVYQAVDLGAKPPRLCLLKEGRRVGELGWDRRDGRWRVRHEARVLSLLRESGVDVPRVYSSFELHGNYYLVTEFIDGESLQSHLRRRRRRMPIAHVLRYGIQLSDFIAQIHAAGWVWRDCKPTNIIVTKRGELKPLDFEGACKIDCPDPLPWMTPTFTPSSEGTEGDSASGGAVDLYALGAVIYLLLTGRMPETRPALLPARSLRRNTPLEVCDLLSELINPGTRPRLDARIVTCRLHAALRRLEGRHSRGASRMRAFTTPVAAAV
jgi:serine/threonine protein kinase